MTPIVARIRGASAAVLIVAFVGGEDGPLAVVVREGGLVDYCDLGRLIVERPTPAFPVGYRFSSAQVEYVDTAEVARR